MTDAHSGLPADALNADGSRSAQTSTTNIGAYMWSALVAERLRIIGHRETVDRLGRTLTTLERMERHEPSGQFYNWYDNRTGAKLTTWPPTGAPLDADPLLRRQRLARGRPAHRREPRAGAARAGAALFDSMDFGFYYRPDVNRILFHYVPDTGAAACCYDTAVSESRIAGYIGIEKGEIPQREYYGAWRSFPDSCDSSCQETRPQGFTRSYLGVSVFEGAYPYNGTRVTPSWGGSMFEALMPSLFVPEERWGPGSWGANHPLFVRTQIHHGLVDAEYGYWGFSPANIPEGGYAVYGVDAIGMDPNGYPSNEDNTLVDHGFAGCPDREPQPDPPPSAYTNGVVTPHAAFLALRWAPREALETSAGSSATSPACTGSGASATRQRRQRPRLGRPTSRSTRAWSWPRSATRSAATCCAAAFVTQATERAVRPRHRRRGVQQRPARLHDHRHAPRRPAARHVTRRRHLRPRRRRPDRRARRR